MKVIDALNILRKNETPIVLLTRFNQETPAHALADYVLYICANESVFRMGAMSSRISQLSMVDFIYAAYISKDYANSIKKISETFIVKDRNLNGIR